MYIGYPLDFPLTSNTNKKIIIFKSIRSSIHLESHNLEVDFITIFKTKDTINKLYCRIRNKVN